MIHYLQFRCFIIDKFCEQPHQNNTCCRLVIVNDPKGHYRNNCWYPHAERSDITYTEDGITWIRHDAIQHSSITIPGDILDRISPIKHPPQTAEDIAIPIYTELPQEEVIEEYQFVNGQRVKIEKPTK